MLRHPKVGKYVVPITPDEARTFGMESLFRQIGIYASQGQHYHPVDQEKCSCTTGSHPTARFSKRASPRPGAMASFTAAATSYSNYGLPAIPFFIYYSMFGFQRIGDLMWAFADARGRGFLLGATAGRTTLAGEGLQHQDGHTQLFMSAIPTCAVYDPAYAYEIGVIIQDGLRRMYRDNEDIFYYLTVYNENYAQPAMPDGVKEGILKGIYRVSPAASGKAAVQLFGSGPILNEALKAQQILAERYQVPSDVWSVTSYSELRREAVETDRWNRLHPGEPERRPYIVKALAGAEGPIIAASDYLKVVADQIAPWLSGRLTALGTDGFGRSENREHLRKFFEVSAEAIAAAALSRLARQGSFEAARAGQALAELGIDPEAPNPARV